MYCPACGSEEKNTNQFCRSCGGDLRRVRNALQLMDGVTYSAIGARDEIGRAVAAKIRETRSASELSTVAEEVLPELEKFLESPAEKRLRRMRTGTMLACIGVGASIGMTLVSLFVGNPDLLILSGFGIVTLFIGLAIFLNGVYLTVPRKAVEGQASAPDELEQDTIKKYEDAGQALNLSVIPSVTDETTQQLKR